MSGCTIHHHVPGETISANIPADATRNITTSTPTYQAPASKPDSQWIPLTGDDTMTIYVNPDYVSKESGSGVVVIKYVIDFKTTQFKGKDGYKSAVVIDGFICSTRQRVAVSGIIYAGNKASGGVVDSFELSKSQFKAETVSRGSMVEDLWDYACN